LDSNQLSKIEENVEI